MQFTTFRYITLRATNETYAGIGILFRTRAIIPISKTGIVAIRPFLTAVQADEFSKRSRLFFNRSCIYILPRFKSYFYYISIYYTMGKNLLSFLKYTTILTVKIFNHPYSFHVIIKV